MLPLLLAASLAVAQVPDSAHVVLVATTDVHGRTTGWDYVAHRAAAGGLARVAPVVDSLRRRYPGQVVVLDAGDLLQGDPFATFYGRVAPATPHPIVEAMNLVGYDVATPGNHDFDFGIPLFRRAVGDAAFPYVSANLFDAAADTLVFAPFRVLQRQGVRVAVAGFTTPGTMVWNRDRLRGKIRAGPIAASAGPTLTSMRRLADLTVVLMHSGLDGPASYDTAGIGDENVSASLAGLPFRPDVVVVGHSHREIADSVINGVHFVQPRRYAESVSVVHVDLRRVGGRWGVSRVRGELVRLGNRAGSPLLTQRMAGAHAAVQRWVDEPVGIAAAPLPLGDARARPSPLHDFVLETLRQRAKADLAAGPVFDLRAGFPADTIRRGHVLTLYPYDNTLRAVRISGEQLRSYLEWSIRYFRTDAAGRVSIDSTVPGYDFDLVRGARYDIDLLQPVGGRIRNLSVRNRPVGATDSFTLALNSHRQVGSGGYTMLRGARVVYDRDESIPDLLIEAIRERGELDAGVVPPSTWRIVPEVASLAVRRLFKVAPDPVAASPRDTVLLRILGTSGLRGDPGVLSRVAGALDSLEQECGCSTVRLDAGDALQGGLLANATTGRSSIELLRPLAFDVAVPGERDFDWGADILARRIAESGRPWVGANLADSATGRPTRWLPPYVMLERDGLRIAVLGYISAEAGNPQPPERTRGLRLGAGELGLHAALAAVRGERPDITILLAHARAECDTVTDVCSGDLPRLATELKGSGVDLVVFGHSGGIMDDRMDGMSVVGTDGPAAIAVVDVVRTDAGGRALRTRMERTGLAADANRTAALPQALEGRADSLRQARIATLKRPVARTDKLPALIAEARRNSARADFGLARPSAIASDLPPGTVTYERLTAVEPLTADLVVVTLTGAQLREALEQALGGAGAPNVELAGAVVRYDPRARPGRRIKDIALAGRRKFRADDAYTLVTDEASASGEAGMPSLGDRPAVRLGLIDVEAVARYLRRRPQPVEIEAASAFVSTTRRE